MQPSGFVVSNPASIIKIFNLFLLLNIVNWLQIELGSCDRIGWPHIILPAFGHPLTPQNILLKIPPRQHIPRPFLFSKTICGCFVTDRRTLSYKSWQFMAKYWSQWSSSSASETVQWMAVNLHRRFLSKTCHLLIRSVECLPQKHQKPYHVHLGVDDVYRPPLCSSQPARFWLLSFNNCSTILFDQLL